MVIMPTIRPYSSTIIGNIKSVCDSGDIIKVLNKEEDYLRYNKFNEFNLSGHTEGKRFRPWQMVNDKRM